MTLFTAALTAQACAAVSAVLLARRRPGHTPAAVALVLLSVIGLVDIPILAALRPLPRPVEGPAIVLVYLDGAINLATSATMAGLCVTVAASPERKRRAAFTVFLVWLFASIVLGALYPNDVVRGASLQRVYFAVDLIALFVATVALIIEGRNDIAAKRSPSTASAVALALVVSDAAVLLAPFSPWRNALFGSDFGGMQLILAILFAVIAIVQGVILWNISRA